MDEVRTIRRVLVLGATGFVGRALVPRLAKEGYLVRAAARHTPDGTETVALGDRVEWISCDVADPEAVAHAIKDVDAVFFLVHAMGGHGRGYAKVERKIARTVRDAAVAAGVQRIVYLGGIAPKGRPSRHLRSRLAVGEVLRAGSVPTIELRASMIVGAGSASWQIVRDLSLRLPAMVLPSWTASRTRPVALDDVVVALVRALDLPLSHSDWFDIPGPDVVSGRDIIATIARVRGRRLPTMPVPLLGVSISSWWLKLVTRAEFSVARELVLGFRDDLLPAHDRYWTLIGYWPRWSFEAAARKALIDETTDFTVSGVASQIEEALVQALSPKLHRPHHR